MNQMQTEPKNMKNESIQKAKIISNINGNKTNNLKSQPLEHTNNKSLDQNDKELDFKLEPLMNDLEIPVTTRVIVIGSKRLSKLKLMKCGTARSDSNDGLYEREFI